ncbi:MAG: hypothetical protein FWC79_05585 [Oscillospiraceae bacterium]|nr:hypothetical protein [Oscillospiraceae bacterium]
MNDCEKKVSNVKGNLFAIVGMMLAIAIQVFYFGFLKFNNFADGIIAGIVVGVCIVLGFKIGKGAPKEAYPIFLIVISIIAVILGFLFGVSLSIYNYGIDSLTYGEAMSIFIDVITFNEIEGTTFTVTGLFIDICIAVGIAIVAVKGFAILDSSDSSAKKREAE